MNALNPHDLTNITLSVLHDHGGYHAGFDGPDRFPGFFAFGNDDEHRRAIAHRLVACWNACRGMAEPELEVARLRAAELSDVIAGGEDDTRRWIVVDQVVSPGMVLVAGHLWALYPDADALEFLDVDHALDEAAIHNGHVLRVVRVG